MANHCDDCRKLDRVCDACVEAAETRAHAMWQAYCKSGLKPIYIPDRPDLVYSDVWRGWRDWVAWTAGASAGPATSAAA